MRATSTVALGDLIAPRLGSVDPSKYLDECFDLYSIPAFEVGRPDVVYGAEIGSAKQLVEPNDVLLSRIVPHIRRAWVVGNDRGRRLVASGEWIVFRSNRFHPQFLRHLLISDAFHVEFMKTVSGVGGSLLRARPAHVVKIHVPLPALAEQRRIAEILDKADALRAKRRAALAQLDTLTQSIFLDMFGESSANEKDWPVARVGDVADVQGGLQVSVARKNLVREVPYLRVANVFRGYLDLKEIKVIRASDTEIARTMLLADDLLLVEGHGNPAEIGRGALWDGSIQSCVHQNHLIRARFDQKSIVPIYACTYLNSPFGRRHLLRAGKTTSGLNTINVSEVRATPIPKPPLLVQMEFAKRVRAIARLKASYQTAYLESDRLFASLQHRAFHGEL